VILQDHPDELMKVSAVTPCPKINWYNQQEGTYPARPQMQIFGTTFLVKMNNKQLNFQQKMNCLWILNSTATSVFHFQTFLAAPVEKF